MFNLFSKDPKKKLQKQYEEKLLEAQTAQRSGDIQKFSELSAEAEKILEEINKVKEKN